MSSDPLEREALLLAAYATRGADSRGRRYAEPGHTYRAPFQRDRDRIVHSAAYRRLSDKTQVFTGELGDYHRTRLTHTHEVASVARTLGRALALNEDLIEALALVHDLGHPPFGHAGEDVLDDCLQACGGFCHNRQALRVVELLETRYPDFPGLNLSAEVLDGQRHRADKSLSQRERPALEVQVVDAADSVAYDTHDADDALELGLVELDELLELPLWHEAATRVRRRYASLTGNELRRAVLHELIDWQVGDLLTQSLAALERHHVDSPAAVRRAPPLVVASEELSARKHELETFLFDRVYRHPHVLAHRGPAQERLRAMFVHLRARPDLLPAKFQNLLPREGLDRTIADHLATLTDRAAEREYARCRMKSE